MPTIILVHGMGSHPGPAEDGTPGSFGQEFDQATTEILQSFENHQNDTLKNHFNIVEFNYDEWFDKMREEMAEDAKSMSEKLSTIDGLFNESVPDDLADHLLGIQSDFGQDKFLYTHWLDVIFYGTLLGAKIRASAAAEVAGMIQAEGSSGDVHIVAHSLGTAVIHDALAQIYDPASQVVTPLDVANDRLGCIWMFANVSALVNKVTGIAPPLQSVVKPSDEGCVQTFYNVHHKFDPFTLPVPFDPPRDGTWVLNADYDQRYADIETEVVVELNTHSFSQYLKDPKVIYRFLRSLLGPSLVTTSDELAAVEAKYAAKDLPAQYDLAKDAFHDLKDNPGQIDNWKAFIKAAQAFTESGAEFSN